MLRRSLYLAALLLLGAYALRLFRLDAQSIWWDEGISLHLATSGAAEIVRDRLDNIHPPLYFFLLKGWLALTGVSPFTGRYLSALAGVVQVALVLAATRFWGRAARLPRWVPWLAAGLMLIAPLSVIYSQEIRVYALLPVAYLLMLLLAHRLLEVDVSSAGRNGKTSASLPNFPASLLAVLALTEWTALHLHYTALLAVAYVAAWGAWVCWRRHDRRGLRRWLIAQALVGLTSLPWFAAVLANRAAIQAEASAGTFATLPVPLPFLFAQVWAFQLTGLAGSLSSTFVRAGSAAAAVLGAGLLLAVAVDWRTRRGDGRAIGSTTFRLAGHWALPLLAGLMVWSVRSFSHPRYIAMFAALLVPLAAVLIAGARGPARRGGAALFAVAMAALSAWGLRQYFFVPGAAKPDMRGVARYLEGTAAPEDLVLIPDTDWSLPFEYDGPAPVVMPGLEEMAHADLPTLIAALDCTGDVPCARSGRVFLVDYPRGSRDWQGRVPYELERRGYWLTETAFDDVVVREYRLEPADLSAGCAEPDFKAGAGEARFGPLTLEGAVIDQGAAADSAATVALCWRLTEATSDSYAASLLLRDDLTGERVAQADAALVNRHGAPTGNWLPGESVVTYHILPLPPGTPPLPYQLSLSVYDPNQAVPSALSATDEAGTPFGPLLPLGELYLSTATGHASLPYDAAAPERWAEPVVASDGLELLGARFGPGPYRPGQTIRVGLTWRAMDALPDLRPSLALEQASTLLADNGAAPAQGRYPTDRWLPGEVVNEFRDVRVPAAANGAATLIVRLGETRVELGPVSIEGAAVQYEPPDAGLLADVLFDNAIRLVSVEPPQAAETARPVPVVLYWQSLPGSIAESYTVFVHLLADDGRILAQSDAVPGAGSRPTNEWLAEEYVTDRHELIWRETGYSGPARLIVGLYDARTGERLRTADGADHYELPDAVMVTPSP